MTDRHLQEEVATVIGVRLRAIPPGGDDSVDEKEATFIMTTRQVAETLVLQRDRMMSEYGRSGDAQTEDDLSRSMTVRREAWQRMKGDKRKSRLRRKVR